MDVTTKKLRRCDLVTVRGRIDASSVNGLANTLAEIKAAKRYKIVLNLKELTYISSAGLSELAEVPPRIKEVLDLAGLTSLFKQYDTEVEAVGHF